jgi:hypothetical protein
MENNDFICTLCIENLMYTANNQHMDGVNEELTHVKQTYDTDSSSNTLIEATQNPHDGWDKSNKENEVETILNSIPSRAQNCNINVSYSNNQLDRDPENSQNQLSRTISNKNLNMKNLQYHVFRSQRKTPQIEYI